MLQLNFQRVGAKAVVETGFFKWTKTQEGFLFQVQGGSNVFHIGLEARFLKFDFVIGL